MKKAITKLKNINNKLNYMVLGGVVSVMLLPISADAKGVKSLSDVGTKIMNDIAKFDKVFYAACILIGIILPIMGIFQVKNGFQQGQQQGGKGVGSGLGHIALGAVLLSLPWLVTMIGKNMFGSTVTTSHWMS